MCECCTCSARAHSHVPVGRRVARLTCGHRSSSGGGAPFAASGWAAEPRPQSPSIRQARRRLQVLLQEAEARRRHAPPSPSAQRPQRTCEQPVGARLRRRPIAADAPRNGQHLHAHSAPTGSPQGCPQGGSDGGPQGGSDGGPQGGSDGGAACAGRSHARARTAPVNGVMRLGPPNPSTSPSAQGGRTELVVTVLSSSVQPIPARPHGGRPDDDHAAIITAPFRAAPCKRARAPTPSAPPRMHASASQDPPKTHTHCEASDAPSSWT